MGASVTPSMPWDGRGGDNPRSEEPGFGLIHRMYVKADLLLSEWISSGGTPAPAQAAYAANMPRAQKMTTGDHLAYMWDLPNDLDRAKPIRFQIVTAILTADTDPEFEIKYTPLAPGDDMAAGATALETTIPVMADGAVGDDDMIRQTYVGEIAANTLDADEELLALYLKCVQDDGAADQVEIVKVRAWYERALA